jgi:small conductance mechanosensitive channel
MTLQHVFHGYPAWVGPTMSFGLAFVLAVAIGELVARLVRVPLVRLLEGGRADLRAPIVRRPVRIVRLVTFLIAFAVLVAPALQLSGVRTGVGLDASTLANWLLRSGLRIALIVLLAWSVVRIVSLAVTRIARDIESSGGLQGAERAKRVRTLGNMARNTVGVMLAGAALMMVLRELNIDIVPLLTGAGILGLAVGFGAQTLVKDIISGFFLILEDQVRVGDAAVINGTGGLVEAITLRTIVLRDQEGTVHVFPNGSITTLSNRSKDFSYFVLDASVAYREDPDRVMDILREVGSALQADPIFGPSIMEPLEILGVEAFAESAVTIRARIKTLPLKQWEVGRELRKRVKLAFDVRGIEIPFPHRTLVFASPPPGTPGAPAHPAPDASAAARQ